MDTTSLHFFSELAKDLNMTKTASRLYISQQTLSNHIARLEEQLDTKLFVRKPSLKLTSAGESVLQFANMVNRGYDNLRDVLSEISHEERGVIRFGSSHFKLQTSIPAILPDFIRRYPNVELRLESMKSALLEQNLLSGNLDLALVSDREEIPMILSDKIAEDRAYLCVRRTLLEEYCGDETSDIIVRSTDRADIKCFEKLPFCLLLTRMGAIINEIFMDDSVRPRCLLRTSDIQVALSMICNQRVAGFSTHTALVLNRSRLPEDLLIFPLYNKDKPLCSSFHLCRHRDRYLAEYIMRFADALRDFYRTVEQTELRKKDASLII